MIISGRRHNMDDIIATVLAVEPLKFIYRGRYVVMLKHFALFSLAWPSVLRRYEFKQVFLCILFRTTVYWSCNFWSVTARNFSRVLWIAVLKYSFSESQNILWLTRARIWTLNWMNHWTIYCLHDRCPTKCHQFNFIHHLLPPHPTLEKIWHLFSFSCRIAVFSIKVLKDDRIIIIAEQRPEASEEEVKHPSLY